MPDAFWWSLHSSSTRTSRRRISRLDGASLAASWRSASAAANCLGRPEDEQSDFNEKTLHLSCNFRELLTLAEMNLKSVKNALYLLLLLARALA